MPRTSPLSVSREEGSVEATTVPFLSMTDILRNSSWTPWEALNTSFTSASFKSCAVWFEVVMVSSSAILGVTEINCTSVLPSSR